MSYYNMTLLENQTGIVGVLQALNVYCEGYLGLGILVMIYLVLFSWAKYRGNGLEAYVNTSWICAIVAILLNLMQILMFRYTLALFIMAGIGAYALHNRQNV